MVAQSEVVSTGKARIYSIDGLRGLAVLLMMEQHLGVWFCNTPARAYKGFFSWQTLYTFFQALGGLAAPIFILLSGVSTAFYLHKYSTVKGLCIRGLVLLLFAYALNLLVPSWFSPGSWYVLHLIGCAMLLASLFKRLSSFQLLMIAGCLLLLSVGVQDFFDTPFVIFNKRMSDMSLPGGALRLMLAEGHFPVLPWLAMYCCGLIAGRWLLVGKFRAILLLAFVTGLVFLVLTAIFLLDISFLKTLPFYRMVVLKFRFYPALTPIFLFLTASALLFLVAAMKLGQKYAFSATNPLVCLGRASLTFFIAHIVLFRECNIRWGLFFRAFSVVSTLGIVCVLLLLSLFLAWLWQKKQYCFGLEWVLRVVSSIKN